MFARHVEGQGDESGEGKCEIAHYASMSSAILVASQATVIGLNSETVAVSELSLSRSVWDLMIEFGLAPVLWSCGFLVGLGPGVHIRETDWLMAPTRWIRKETVDSRG